MRMLWRMFTIFALSAFLTPHASAAEVLTNDSIVMMVKAGLGDELIISKLTTSEAQFDLSTASILKLRSEGVSERIIKVMIETSAKREPAEQRPPQVSGVHPMASFLGLPPAVLVNSSSLYVKLGEKVVEMPPLAAEVQHAMGKHWIPFYFGSGDTWHFIRGQKSVVRIKDRRPVFYTRLNPSAFLLVRFSYQPSKDIRYVVSTGRVFKSMVPVTFNKKSDEFFELVAGSELDPGEYAFINAMTFFDFGIEWEGPR